jgi:hypothetical protein
MVPLTLSRDRSLQLQATASHVQFLRILGDGISVAVVMQSALATVAM